MSKRYDFTAWDNSDRSEFYDDYGNLETTWVDRYGWDGEYSHTDVYDADDRKVGSFVK